MKEAENKVHKELLGRNQLILIKPSDTLGLMSPETYSDWAQDEVISLTTGEQASSRPIFFKGWPLIFFIVIFSDTEGYCHGTGLRDYSRK